jgi:translation initiation factor 5A
MNFIRAIYNEFIANPIFCSQLIDVTDDDPAFVSLLDQSGAVKDDLKLPEGELGKQIKDDFAAGKSLVVAVQSAMGLQQIMSVKEDSKA